jgi:hypothetical protein
MNTWNDTQKRAHGEQENNVAWMKLSKTGTGGGPTPVPHTVAPSRLPHVCRSSAQTLPLAFTVDAHLLACPPHEVPLQFRTRPSPTHRPHLTSTLPLHTTAQSCLLKILRPPQRGHKSPFLSTPTLLHIYPHSLHRRPIYPWRTRSDEPLLRCLLGNTLPTLLHEKPSRNIIKRVLNAGSLKTTQKRVWL